MAELAQQSQPTGCPVLMSDDRPCGRPIYVSPPEAGRRPDCLMHSDDPNKDRAQFKKEIEAILAGTSSHHRPKDRFDFCGFVFPEAYFEGARFTQRVDFAGAMFTEEANFRGAIFTQGTNFFSATFARTVIFNDAKFAHDADFFCATFSQGAHFFGVRFNELACFDQAQFGEARDRLSSQDPADANSPIADFQHSDFLKPDLVSFRLVNLSGSTSSGLRARFAGCKIEGVRFEAVNWHQWDGRMVLQDEIDLMYAPRRYPARYEVVAATYRQLISNFEKARAYDLAEDCSIGAMEMKRLDPAQPIFVRGAVNFYRWASNYGSSYQRALGVLALMVLVFGLLYSLVGLTPRPGQTVLEPAGFIHAVEVATFKSETHAIAGSGAAWLLEILERVLIPAQVALFLLALRRRFRR